MSHRNGDVLLEQETSNEIVLFLNGKYFWLYEEHEPSSCSAEAFDNDKVLCNIFDVLRKIRKEG